MATTVVGKEVGPIGFGLMGLGAPRAGLTEQETDAAIKAALDAGCNYFDAGEFYGTPEHNTLTILNRYLARHPEDDKKIVLNVKGGLAMPGFTPAGSREAVSQSIDNCLRLLGPNGHIDQWEPARKDQSVDYEDDTLAAVDSYVKAGKIGAIACSEINAQTLRSAAKKFNITAVETELSLFCLGPLTNGLLQACGELDIPVVAYSPLGRGFLGGQLKKNDDMPEKDMRRMHPRYYPENFAHNVELVNKVEAIAKRKGCTTGQIAINWVVSLSKRPGMPTIIPIPGSTKPDRIKENATIIDLTEEDLAEIDTILETFEMAGSRYPEAFMKHLDL